MSARSFTATVEHDDRGRVWVTVPFDPTAEWGARPAIMYGAS